MASIGCARTPRTRENGHGRYTTVAELEVSFIPGGRAAPAAYFIPARRTPLTM